MGRFTRFAIVLFIFAITPAMLLAQRVPSPDDAFEVIDFYYNGKGKGVVMTESKICKDIHREGDLKYECKNEIIEFGEMKADGSAPDIFHKIKKGESVYVWMAFLVPMGAEEQIFLRYNLDGNTKLTSGKASIKGSIRYRTWKKFTPPSKGKWEIEIFLDKDSGPSKLSTYILTVE